MTDEELSKLSLSELLELLERVVEHIEISAMELIEE